MLKKYNEFLNERAAPNKAAVKWMIAKKFAGVPAKIVKQIARHNERKEDIAAMIKTAETREEKSRLKRQLLLMSKEEFELKKKAQLAKKKAQLAKKEAKADKK